MPTEVKDKGFADPNEEVSQGRGMVLFKKVQEMSRAILHHIKLASQKSQSMQFKFLAACD